MADDFGNQIKIVKQSLISQVVHWQCEYEKSQKEISKLRKAVEVMEKALDHIHIFGCSCESGEECDFKWTIEQVKEILK